MDLATKHNFRSSCQWQMCLGPRDMGTRHPHSPESFIMETNSDCCLVEDLETSNLECTRTTYKYLRISVTSIVYPLFLRPIGTLTE